MKLITMDSLLSFFLVIYVCLWTTAHAQEDHGTSGNSPIYLSRKHRNKLPPKTSKQNFSLTDQTSSNYQHHHIRDNEQRTMSHRNEQLAPYLSSNEQQFHSHSQQTNQHRGHRSRDQRRYSYDSKFQRKKSGNTPKQGRYQFHDEKKSLQQFRQKGLPVSPTAQRQMLTSGAREDIKERKHDAQDQMESSSAVSESSGSHEAAKRSDSDYTHYIPSFLDSFVSWWSSPSSSSSSSSSLSSSSSASSSVQHSNETAPSSPSVRFVSGRKRRAYDSTESTSSTQKRLKGHRRINSRYYRNRSARRTRQRALRRKANAFLRLNSKKTNPRTKSSGKLKRIANPINSLSYDLMLHDQAATKRKAQRKARAKRRIRKKKRRGQRSTKKRRQKERVSRHSQNNLGKARTVISGGQSTEEKGTNTYYTSESRPALHQSEVHDNVMESNQKLDTNLSQINNVSVDSNTNALSINGTNFEELNASNPTPNINTENTNTVPTSAGENRKRNRGDTSVDNEEESLEKEETQTARDGTIGIENTESNTIADVESNEEPENVRSQDNEAESNDGTEGHRREDDLDSFKTSDDLDLNTDIFESSKDLYRRVMTSDDGIKREFVENENELDMASIQSSNDFAPRGSIDSFDLDNDGPIPVESSHKGNGLFVTVRELVLTVKELYAHQELNRQKIKELSNRYRTHRTDLHLTEGKVATLDQMIRGLASTLQNLATTSGEIRQEMTMFRNRQQRSDRSHRRHRQETERLLEKVNRLEEGHGHIKALHRLNSGHMQLNSEQSKMETKFERLDSRIQRLERLDYKKASRMNKFNQKFESFQETLVKVQTNMKDVASVVNDCSDQVDTLREEMDDLTENVEISTNPEFIEILREIGLNRDDIAKETKLALNSNGEGSRNIEGQTNEEVTKHSRDKTSFSENQSSSTRLSINIKSKTDKNGEDRSRLGLNSQSKLRKSRHLDSTSRNVNRPSTNPAARNSGFHRNQSRTGTDDERNTDHRSASDVQSPEVDISTRYMTTPSSSSSLEMNSSKQNAGAYVSTQGSGTSQMKTSSVTSTTHPFRVSKKETVEREKEEKQENDYHLNAVAQHSTDNSWVTPNSVTFNESSHLYSHTLNFTRLNNTLPEENVQLSWTSMKPSLTVLSSESILKPTPAIDGKNKKSQSENILNQEVMKTNTVMSSPVSSSMSLRLSSSFVQHDKTSTVPTSSLTNEMETPPFTPPSKVLPSSTSSSSSSTASSSSSTPNLKQSQSVKGSPTSTSQKGSTSHHNTHPDVTQQSHVVYNHHFKIVTNTILQDLIHHLEQRIRTLETSMEKLTSSTVPGLQEKLSSTLTNQTASLKAELFQQKDNRTYQLEEEMATYHNKSSLLEEKIQTREMDLRHLKTITGQTTQRLTDLANQVSAINMSDFISRLQQSLSNFSRSVLTLDQWKIASGDIINTSIAHETRLSQLADSIRANTHTATKLTEKVYTIQTSSRRWYRNLQGHVIRLNNTIQDLKERTENSLPKNSQGTQATQPSMVLQSKMDSLHIQLLYNSNRLSTLETKMLNRSLEQCRRSTAELEQHSRILRHGQEQETLRKELDLLQEKVQRIDLSVYRLHGNSKTNDAIITKLSSDIQHMKPISSQVMRLEMEVDNLLHQVPRDCHAYYTRGFYESGVYIIHPKHVSRSIRVYCVMENYDHSSDLDRDAIQGTNQIIADSAAQPNSGKSAGTLTSDSNAELDSDEATILKNGRNKNVKRRSKKKGKSRQIAKQTDGKTGMHDFPKDEGHKLDPDFLEDDEIFIDDLESKLNKAEIYNGGWTVIQRRSTGRVNFTRSWLEYATGFGRADDEHWLGNDVIYLLTNQDDYECRIVMTDVFDGVWEARYDRFRIGNQAESFRLQVKGYHGNASDGLSSSNHMAFSTLDRDNDASSSHCALYGLGGWWYRHCHISNLNGPFDVGLVWFNRAWKDWVQMKASLIMVKPRNDKALPSSL